MPILDPLGANGDALVHRNSLPNAPKWVDTLTARYGIPHSNGGAIDFDNRTAFVNDPRIIGVESRAELQGH